VRRCYSRCRQGYRLHESEIHLVGAAQGLGAGTGDDQTPHRSTVGGNPRLKPQTATTITPGVVLEPQMGKNPTIPRESWGPLFSQHNHFAAVCACPNGDILACWYTTVREPGRELAQAASRLRAGSDRWDPASLFFDVPDVNDHAPVLLGDGKGGFQKAVPYALGSITWPTGIAVGDFNGDGHLDVAVTIARNGIDGGDVRILLGNGDGTLRAAVSYPTGSSPISLVAGDINGDGFRDLVVTCGQSGTMFIFLGSRNGLTAAPILQSVKKGWGLVALGDLDGDGRAEIVTADQNDDTITIYRSK